MKTFKCEICGNKHKFHTLIGTVEPDIIGNITRGELNGKLDVLAKSVFAIDRKYLIAESEMSIDINDYDDQLDFYVWIEVDGKILSEIFTQSDKSGLITVEGKLIVEIPFYANEIDSIVEIEIDLDKDDAARVTKVKRIGKLKKDFEEGIELDEMKAMLSKEYHAEEY